MSEIILPQLIDTIRATSGAYYKLTILVGAAQSGKTHWLSQVAIELDLPIINLGLLLSQRLLSLTRHQRELRAQDVTTDVIDENYETGLCLDNIELLFDSTLKLNPLVFLREITRNRLVVATWNGILVNGELRFGQIGHPDYFSQTVNGFPVVSVADDKLQLHLTT
jgi:hypothetical protein